MYRFKTFSILLVTAALLPFSANGADRRQDYEELAASSDKILLGSVALKSSYWADDSRIYTDIVLTSEVSVKGADQGAVVVRVLGGTVGDTKMSVSDGPEFSEREHVIVFLRRESDHFTVVGRAAGSIRTSSPDAPFALEGAFSHAESLTGTRMESTRGLARNYLDRHAESLPDPTEPEPTQPGPTQPGPTQPGPPQPGPTGQTGCYSVDGAKWGTSSAAYRIGATIPFSWVSSIDASAATWSNAGAAFRLVKDPSSSNELSYLDLVAKYGSSFANTFAVTTTWSSISTGRISRATVEVNTRWAWSTTGAPSTADVQNIMTHEFGHWMRLLDIYSPTACSEVTMWGSATFGEIKKRTLDPSDIAGFVTLYGAGGSTGGGSPTVSAPSLVSPANGASGVSTAPVLTWSASPGATSYDVYLGTSPSPSFAATLSSTAYQVGPLTAGTTYYWRVVAKNASSSASSGTFSFRVSVPAPAPAPAPGPAPGPGPGNTPETLMSPPPGATGVSTSPTMRWSAVAGAIAYDLYVGTTPSPLLVGSINATMVRVSGFRPGTVY